MRPIMLLPARATYRAGPSSLHSTASWLHISRNHAAVSQSRAQNEADSSPKPRPVASNVAFAGPAFFTSTSALLRVLRRKQTSYRLRSLKSKRVADMAESRDLARAEIRWITEHVCKEASSSKHATIELNREQRRTLIHMATQMTKMDVPISYLLGTLGFGCLPKPLLVRMPILLPRPETEHWANTVALTIIERFSKYKTRDAKLRVADLCTGTGCVALLVAHILRLNLGEQGWTVVASDRSPEAVKLAQENRDMLGFSEQQVQIVQANVFEDADMKGLCQHAGGSFDVILSNPPYIPRRDWEALPPSVKLYEDPLALIGEIDSTKLPSNAELATRKDSDGLAFHRRLAELCFTSWFSTLISAPGESSTAKKSGLLVAEYGKGQQGDVYRTFVSQAPPALRMPMIVKLPEKLFICGVGNARTHPLTRHSVGQVALDSLLEQLVQMDRVQRQRLINLQNRLESFRENAIQDTQLDPIKRKTWSTSIPSKFPVVRVTSLGREHSTSKDAPLESSSNTFSPFNDYQDVMATASHKMKSDHPNQLSRTVDADKGGWSATVPLLVPSPTDNFIVYQVDVVLYKPSLAMNLSGIALRSFLEAQPQSKKALAATENLLVLQDEMDLDFGEVKRRDTGSARGHNGIRDIFVRLKVRDSPGGQRLTRLRIGIGRPSSSNDSGSASRKGKNKGKAEPGGLADWVLSPLKDSEMESLCRNTKGSVLEKVSESTSQWIRDRVIAIAPEMQALRQQPDFVGNLSIINKKDQFGVDRVIWIER